MTIGDIIRNRRKELGMNQTDLAKAVGTTNATVSRWESGDIGKMKSSHMMAVSRVLGLNISLFFRRNDILTVDEEKLLFFYRKSDDNMKAAVKRLLGVPERSENSDLY